MAEFFVDLSAATNGDGTAATPYNTLTTALLIPGATYWLRRANATTVGTIGVTVPTGVRLLGWPMPGDPYYDERPVNASWDSDTAEYCTITTSNENIMILTGVNGVCLHRIFVDSLYPGGGGETYNCKLIHISNSSRCTLTNCRVGRRAKNIYYSGNYLLAILQSTGIIVDNTTIVRGYTTISSGSAPTSNVYVEDSTNLSINVTIETNSASITCASTYPCDVFNNMSLSTVVIKYVFLSGVPATGNKSGLSLTGPRNNITVLNDGSAYAAGLQYSVTTIFSASGTTFNTLYVDMPTISYVSVTDAGACDATIVTNTVLGISGGTSGTSSILVGANSKVCVLAATPTGILMPTNSFATKVTSIDAASVFLDKVAEPITINATASGNIQYYDEAQIYRGRTSNTSCMTSTAHRSAGSAASVEVTPLTATPVLWTVVGDSTYSLFDQALLAGTHTIRFYMAARHPTLLRFRYGMIFLRATWTDGNGADLVVSDELVFTTADTWVDISDYVTAYLEVTVTVDRPTNVNINFETLLSSATVSKLYIDPLPVITTV